MSLKMSLVLILWLLAYLPAASSRPSRDTDGSGAVMDKPAKRQSFGCGQVNSNELKSPNYPNNYPNDMDCDYNVAIPVGMAMNISFDAFDVELSSNCVWDYLKISCDNGQPAEKYCGVKTGTNVLLTASNCTLTFHSDGFVTRPGYRLTFTFFFPSNGTVPPTALPPAPTPSTMYPVPSSSAYPPMPTNPPAPTPSSMYPVPSSSAYPTNPPWYTTAPPPKDCGQVEYNTLKSPNYPNNYPNVMDCTYQISIPFGKAMNIHFDNFTVEFQSSCSWDYLEIINDNNQTVKKYCGTKTGTNVLMNGSYFIIKFHSDCCVQSKGYHLTFTPVPQSNGTLPPPTIQPVCGSIQGNQLTSPGYPFYNYPNNLNCTYWVHIPHGNAMRIHFDYFRVDCRYSYDYLKIINERNQPFGTHCGPYRPSDVTVTGHYLVMIFHSDSYYNDNGFKLIIYPVPLGNASTSAPYTTPYRSTTHATARPNPCGVAQSNISCLVDVIKYLLDKICDTVNKEHSGNNQVSVREYKARVKRAFSDVHAAMKSEGLQKRDFTKAMEIDQLEKKAADLMKQLETKEARYKKRAMMKKKLTMLAPKKA